MPTDADPDEPRFGNKHLVTRLIEAFRAPDADSQLEDILSVDYAEHAPRRHDPADRASVVRDVAEMFRAFPDFTPTIELQLEEGDKVATRVTWRGTHNGTFAGLPATGTEVVVTVHRIDRVADGQVVESWLEFDPLSVPTQIGVVSGPT